MLSDTDPIGRYIEDRQDSELAKWDVLIAGVDSDDESRLDTSLGIPVYCQQRTEGAKSDNTTIRVTNKQRVASRGVERIGLSDSAIAESELEFRRSKGLADHASVNFPDRAYRAKRERPLLIIHLLKMLRKEDATPIHDQPVVAWSIAFPKSELPEKRVEYVVTTTWLRENFRDEADDEDMDTDDA
jgi:hypothetical protein